MYAGPVTTTGGDARWARGLAVAVVTAPGVLLAQLLVTGNPPALRSALVVAAVVLLVAGVAPARTVPGTAALAAVAQLAGHLVLALTGPHAQTQTQTQGCLSVVGHGADLGVRYALVHADACPPGTLNAGPALTAVAAAVAAAALVLLGSALLAALTGVLVAALAAGLELVRELADAVLPAAALLGVVRVTPAARRCRRFPSRSR